MSRPAHQHHHDPAKTEGVDPVCRFTGERPVATPTAAGMGRPNPTGLSRYTRNVGWNLRTISITMLMVLALLPLSGALCAITCDVAAHTESSRHHHGAAHEAKTAAAPETPVISVESAHRCDHD